MQNNTTTKPIKTNNMTAEFILWLKDYYQYKDGMWYCKLEKPYVTGSQRKFYTEEELIRKYKETYG